VRFNWKLLTTALLSGLSLAITSSGAQGALPEVEQAKVQTVVSLDAPKPDVVRDDHPPLSKELKIPIYEWKATDGVAPQAVIVAMHGTTLHAGVFDYLGHKLAKEHYVVVAPDWHGFGRWLSEPETYGGKDNGVSFYKSKADLIRLLNALHRDYPGLPVYCLGESVGANLALWVGGVSRNLTDGLILSSPCISRRNPYYLPIVRDFFTLAVAPHKKFKLYGYAKTYLTEDPDVIRIYLADPLMRKRMGLYESLQSLHANNSSLWYVADIPESLPILVIEGTKDKMFNQSKLPEFLERVPSKDQTVVELKNRGHIQIETPFVRNDVETAIFSWLANQQRKNSAIVKNRGTDSTASLSANPNQSVTQ
jgi:alpha-beta hydrolase superfamily lysophospholipase